MAQDTICQLIRSMPRHYRECIQAHGGPYTLLNHGTSWLNSHHSDGHVISIFHLGWFWIQPSTAWWFRFPLTVVMSFCSKQINQCTLGKRFSTWINRSSRGNSDCEYCTSFLNFFEQGIYSPMPNTTVRPLYARWLGEVKTGTVVRADGRKVQYYNAMQKKQQHDGPLVTCHPWEGTATLRFWHYKYRLLYSAGEDKNYPQVQAALSSNSDMNRSLFTDR